MALVKSTLKAAVLAALQKQAAKTAEGDDPAASAEQLASDIADAVDAYIKTATVVSVVTGTSPSGPVTGTATSTTIT